MRYLKVFCLALLAVFAFGAFAAVSASAQGLPTILPETKEKGSTAVNVGEPVFKTLAGTIIKCTKATGETTETTAGKSLGPLHIKFTGCFTENNEALKCTGLGDATSGEILVLGEWHLVYDTGGVELGVAILFLISPSHFTCAAVVLVVVLGHLVCLILAPYTLAELHEFHCKGNGMGDQTETYLNDAGETVKPELLASTNEAAEETSEEQALGLILWLEKNKDIDVLIMMT